MAASTPRGLNHPTSDDKIKDGSSPSALADDFAVLASSADAAIGQGVEEAKSAAALDATAKADTAKSGAIATASADATAKANNAKWYRGNLPNGTNYQTMNGTGMYWVADAAKAATMIPELPEIGPGLLTRVETTYGNYAIYWEPFAESAPGGAKIPARRWRMDKYGATPTGWLADTAIPRKIALNSDLNTLTKPSDNGPHAIYDTNQALTIANRPFESGFYLDVKSWNNIAWHIAWPAGAASDLTPKMRKYTIFGGAQWSEWLPMGGGGSKATAEVPHRHMMLKQRNRIGHGGTIGVGDRVAVGLSFDHGFVKYRDILLPHLTRLGLPHTLAVNTSTLGAGESAGVSYPQLQDWSINKGAPLANHGRSHSDATTPEAIRDMFVGSLDLLHDNCPKTIIDQLITPGTGGTKLDGFDQGKGDYALWWEHDAGRVMLDHHATVTAAMPGSAIPLDGEPIQSMGRVGFDSASWVNAIKTQIGQLVGTGLGIQIFNHPNLIDDGITTASIVDFLEWLAAERDAGRIEVLSSVAFAWAKSGTTKRHDLIAGQAWTGASLAVPLAQNYQWARGFHRQLAVKSSSSAEVTLTVTDDTGLLNSTVTQTVDAGGMARLNFGIPTDSTSLTLTATTSAGTLSEHTVYAV